MGKGSDPAVTARTAARSSSVVARLGCYSGAWRCREGLIGSQPLEVESRCSSTDGGASYMQLNGGEAGS